LSQYNKELRLGIDTGGTYTDAALLDSSDNIVAHGKALTTQNNLATGIHNVLEQLPAAAMTHIRLVSLSTTLATNAVVEERGAPVGLILAGYNPKQMEQSNLVTAIRNGQFTLIAGSHDAIGNETAPLRIDNIPEILKDWQTKVSAIGISGIFSVRNPTHEIRLKNLVENHIDLPITCGYELASLLDAPRRAVTVAINASLIPFISELIKAVHKILKEHNVKCPLMIVKGDGSLIPADIALKRPIETVMSGPAASIVGACHLQKTKNSIVADMGGTTTDIAIIANGKINLSDQETIIGDWHPMVETIKLVSIGLGADSEARYQGGIGLAIGPRRVVPMSLLGNLYPHVNDILEAQLEKTSTARTNRFVLRHHATEEQITNFTPTERQLWEQLDNEPIELEAIKNKDREQAKAIGMMMRKGIVIYSGFTPSDAAHILEYTNHWSTETAHIGAKLWGKQMRQIYGWGAFDFNNPKEIAQLIHAKMIKQIIEALIQSSIQNKKYFRKPAERKFIIELISEFVMKKMEDTKNMFSINFSDDLHLVAVGAPSHLYYPNVSNILGITYCPTPHADIANAVGAVVGTIIQKARITISQPVTGQYRVFQKTGPINFSKLNEAINFAKTQAKERAFLQAQESGAIDIEVYTTENYISVTPDDLSENIFFECLITGIATGRPCLA
tara:strand:+ start:11008 stop:13032 length:2025 start_codon:yes stop_codon:yes gene_type:complete